MGEGAVKGSAEVGADEVGGLLGCWGVRRVRSDGVLLYWTASGRWTVDEWRGRWVQDRVELLKEFVRVAQPAGGEWCRFIQTPSGKSLAVVAALSALLRRGAGAIRLLRDTLQ